MKTVQKDSLTSIFYKIIVDLLYRVGYNTMENKAEVSASHLVKSVTGSNTFSEYCFCYYVFLRIALLSAFFIYKLGGAVPLQS